MTSKFTREELLNIIETDHVQCGEASALARMALAAMDSEPVYQYRIRNGYNGQVTEWQTIRRDQVDFVMKAQPLNAEFQVIAVPQPAPERDQVRSEHAEWSQTTFGNVGPVGPLKHLSNEALEAAAEPGDLSEWADMQFLLWDAQRRAGITDEQITLAMIEKLAVNKQREWPEPKDGEPRLHIKEQPAPVVPPMQHWEELCRQYPDMSIRDAIIRAAWWNHCRAAMLQAGNSPVIPDGYVMVPKEPTEEMLRASYREASVYSATAYRAMLAASQHDTPALNSLQSVDSVAGKWIPVSERMPEDRISVILWDAEIGEVTSGHYSHKTHTFYHCGDAIQNEITHWMPLPAAPQEVPDGQR